MEKLRNTLIDILFWGVFLGVFTYLFISLIHTEGAIKSVQVNGKKVPLKQVRVLKIPPETYKSLKDNPSTWSLYLTGHKKRILLILRGTTICHATYQGKCYENIEDMFKKYPKLRNSYKKHITAGDGPQCKGAYANFCPMKWLKEQCSSYCIINPNTQEVIVDYSRDEQQILPLLLGFAEWDKDPLLNQRKK